MVRPGLDFFSLVFALFKAGVVPVMIDPGIGPRNLGQCCREAEPEVFIGIPKAVWARRLLGWGSKTVRHTILVAPGGAGVSGAGFTTLDDLRRAGRDVAGKGSSRPPSIALFSSDETAAILFTSGSTGPPKGAVYTHAIFQAQVESFRSLYAIEPGEIDLCTFPLFALFAPALGMTAIVPDMDPTRPARVDPGQDLRGHRRFRRDEPVRLAGLVAAARPGSVRRSLRRLPTLKRVISAGAPVSAKVLEQLAPLLDRPAQVYTPYGATESLPVASIGSGEVLGRNPPRHRSREWACASAARSRGSTPGSSGSAMTRFPSGPTTCSCPTARSARSSWPGPVVTREYFNRPEATRLAKIADPDAAEVLSSHGRPGLSRRRRDGSGSAGGSRTG